MKKKKEVVSKAYARALAEEIVNNLVKIGQYTTRPFRRAETKPEDIGMDAILVDTSVLIDGRILPIVNSGFLTGLLVIPQFVLGELQYIADSEDSLRRAKGRRGLDVVNALKNKKIVTTNPPDIKEVDQKLIALARAWASQKPRLLTVDFNLAQIARAQGIKILNINDLAQALKVSLMPGEEFTVKITHEGKERAQGVGYLPDGTMVIVDEAKSRVGQDVVVTITKIHQSPAGQLFFARIK